MDELVQEKLKAMGYREVPEELAVILREWKKRQDAVRPAPLSLDAIVCATLLYDMFAKRAKKTPPEQEGQ